MAKALFQHSEAIWLLTSYYGEEPRPKKYLKPLKHCGLNRKDFTHLGKVAQTDPDVVADFDTNQYRFWDATQLTEKSQLKEVLWLVLGAELGIKPDLRTDAYFVDYQRSVVLHPYDDRGMDVGAATKDALIPLYHTFGDWLLEWNRPEIQAHFGG